VKELIDMLALAQTEEQISDVMVVEVLYEAIDENLVGFPNQIRPVYFTR